jgi:hypothetical protein
MTDSFALLANEVSHSRGSVVLGTDAVDISARADVIATDRGDLLLLRAWVGEARKYVYLVVDEQGFIVARVRGVGIAWAYDAAYKELARMRYTLPDRDENEELRAEPSHDGRRAAVLKDEASEWSLRVKAIRTWKETCVHFRVEHAPLGFIHIVIHEDSRIVAVTTGGNDSDAWDRMRGELKRRRIDVD